MPRKLYGRPRGDAWVASDDEPLMVGTTVEEEETGGWYDTGLLGPDGQPIHAYQPPKDPIGFLWHDERGELRPAHEFYGPSDGNAVEHGDEGDAGDEGG